MHARLFDFCIICIAIFILCSCSWQRSADAFSARKKLVGMSKNEVLDCLGSPHKKKYAGGAVEWSYHSAKGQANPSGIEWSGHGANFHYVCDADLVVKNNKVAAVRFNGPPESWPDQDRQCAYAMKYCADPN